jgi:hypothetical protein
MNFLEAAAEAFKRGWPKGPRNFRVPLYNDYIHSPDWEDRKRRYWDTHQKRCVICLTYKNIDLHHLSYADLGNERDEDLVAVCRTHHDQFHQRYGVAGDMHRQWDRFFNEKSHPLRGGVL